MYIVCMLLYTEGVGMYVCCYILRGRMYVCCYILRGWDVCMLLYTEGVGCMYAAMY